MSNMTPEAFEAMNRQHGNHIDEDISADKMSRHLRDALEEAKVFLGIDKE